MGRDTNPDALVALRGLNALGWNETQLSMFFRAIAGERNRARALADGQQLVWTGPDIDQTRSRDTGVVVREMFREAKRDVLIATYSYSEKKNAELLFGELAARMDIEPDLRVRMVFGALRRFGESRRAAVDVYEAFVERFRTNRLWPGRRIPHVFYYPDALERNAGEACEMHAKCVVIDDETLYLGSANFSYQAHHRNIEAGVKLQNPVLARQLRVEFDSLIASGVLQAVGGLARLGE